MFFSGDELFRIMALHFQKNLKIFLVVYAVGPGQTATDAAMQDTVPGLITQPGVALDHVLPRAPVVLRHTY